MLHCRRRGTQHQPRGGPAAYDAATADQADTEARTRRGSRAFPADTSRDGTGRGRSDPAGTCAYRIVTLSARAVERTRQASIGEVGHLSVGYYDSAILDAIPAIVSEFRHQYPDVKVSFELVRRAQVDYLRDKLLHIGAGRDYPQQQGVVRRTVAVENLYVAVRERSALTSCRPVTVADLRDRPPGRVSASRPGFADDVIRMCRSAGFSPVIAVEASTTSSRAWPTSQSAKPRPLSPRRLPRPGRTESRSSRWAACHPQRLNAYRWQPIRRPPSRYLPDSSITAPTLSKPPSAALRRASMALP